MKQQMKTISALLACILLICAPVFAEQLSNVDLSERITRLEESMKQGILPAGWAERITLSGAIELEAGYESLEFDDPEMEDEESSDLSLATAEVGVDVAIMEHVSGFALFKYEDDEDVIVDEAFILLDGKEALPLYLKAGKLYVPFGKFESNMISDPLTLELGETRETAVEIGFSHQGLYGAVYAFNGDVDKPDEDSQIDNFGASLGYSMETDAFSLDVGVSWINNIMEADFNQDVIDEETEGVHEMGLDCALEDYVSGFGAHAIVTVGPVTLIGEYITMLDEAEWNMSDIEPGTMETMGINPVESAEEISAWNVEAGYAFTLGEKEVVAAIAYQGSENYEDAMPEKRYMGSLGIGIFEGTTLAVEYLHDEYEAGDEADVFTAQLAIEF